MLFEDSGLNVRSATVLILVGTLIILRVLTHEGFRQGVFRDLSMSDTQ